MRAFVIVGTSARTSGDFELKGFAGASGRMDVIAVSMIGALSYPKPRSDVVFIAVLEGPPSPPVTIIVKGWEVRRVPESEVEVGRYIRDALRGEFHEEFPIHVEKMSFEAVISKLRRDGFDVYYLHEKGEDIWNIKLPENIALVLGDHIGLPPEHEKVLDRQGVKRLRLGPRVYLSWYCTVIANEVLDRVSTTGFEV